MRVHFDHRWEWMQGMFVVTLFSVWWGYERVGVCILNFVVEFDRS